MFGHIAIIGLAFVISLAMAAAVFGQLPKVVTVEKGQNFSAVAAYVVLVLVVCVAVLFCGKTDDFVADISKIELVLPWLSGMIVAVAALWGQKKWVDLACLVAIVISVSGTNNLQIDFWNGASVWVNKLLTIGAWWLFALGFRSVSGLNPLVQVEQLTVGIGFVLLYLLGLAPLMMGAVAAALVAVMVVAYLKSKVFPFGVAAAPLWGFVIGWFGVSAYEEFLLPCFVIFVMFYLAELAFSFFFRVANPEKYRFLEYSSVTVRAFVKGLPPAELIRSIIMTNVVLIMFGLFQLNGVNVYSVPVFAALIVWWQLYKMFVWQNVEQDSKAETIETNGKSGD